MKALLIAIALLAGLHASAGDTTLLTHYTDSAGIQYRLEVKYDPGQLQTINGRSYHAVTVTVFRKSPMKCFCPSDKVDENGNTYSEHQMGTPMLGWCRTNGPRLKDFSAALWVERAVTGRSDRYRVRGNP